jgi:YVTN family beta-propeller protein
VFGSLFWRVSVVTLLPALAACGGSEGTVQDGAAPPAVAAQPLGEWSPLLEWPHLPVHAVLLSGGKVLTYGTDATGNQSAMFEYSVWDPSRAGTEQSHTVLPNQTSVDVFCGAQLQLPMSGEILIAGGDTWKGTTAVNSANQNSTLFSAASEQLTKAGDMKRPRWYATMTRVADGRTLIQGGYGGADFPEMRDIAGNFTLLEWAETGALSPYYPRNFLMPDGRLFGVDVLGQTYFIDVDRKQMLRARTRLTEAHQGVEGTAAMYRPGKILHLAGNSNRALVVEPGQQDQVAVRETQPMAYHRRFGTATLLADGTVLATGGSRIYNRLVDVAYTPEIWNPVTGAWRRGAPAQRSRLYHSTALLLPDASVLVGGGGSPGPELNLNAEIYFPPYLFQANGQRAARPEVVDAPAVLEHGRLFAVRAKSARPVSRVTLVGAGSVTHGFNMGQRLLELPFGAAGDRLAIHAPHAAAEAPPGLYMLFVIDEAGVPSVARMVQLPVPAEAPEPVPFLALLRAPQAIGSRIGEDARVKLLDRPVAGLRFDAAALPPGIRLNATEATLEGAPTHPGTYDVVVGATNGAQSVSVRISWEVTPSTPLVVFPPPALAPAGVGDEIRFEVAASEGGARYRWVFGDGETSGWLDQPVVRYRYGQPGVFQVTVVAQNAKGEEARTSFRQVVYRPTVGRSASSSAMALREAGEALTVWAVNEDNDSVTVLNAKTLVAVTEIAVGRGPRSVAVAGSRSVLVTNKEDATLAVLDADAHRLVGQIALPRNSRPHGVVADPEGRFAYVALEASRQIARVDLAALRVSDLLMLDASVRHLSLAADGRTLLATRFITPPLPGESDRTPSTAKVPAIYMVDLPSFKVVRAIDLYPSQAPDTEQSGRGIPNYLGPPVISPDGTQAWVASKQDNVFRGAARDGRHLDFQNTVRAVASKIDLARLDEVREARIDFDDASTANAAAYDATGAYLFVALEGARAVAVVDAHRGHELMRIFTGLRPVAVQLSPDNKRLFVLTALDRQVTAFDIGHFLVGLSNSAEWLASARTVTEEKLPADVLLGKQLFYDALDRRLTMASYMSCASCHDEGGQDGRVWDLTGSGEGLRNTLNLRGRGGLQRLLHWSGNFDEVQDFESQIRSLAGGMGLLDNALYYAGDRRAPLGAKKAGLSKELDALAAYLRSLDRIDESPLATVEDAQAVAFGRAEYGRLGCGTCHGSAPNGVDAAAEPKDVGTLSGRSGRRNGGALSGLMSPPLGDAWATPPYLHDGSAMTIEAAIERHRGVPIANIAALAAYLRAGMPVP